MTREIKVSLLVGLLFVIAIGILLSDHFRTSQEPAPAVLDGAGATVRETVNAPGANTPMPPVTLAPDQINPRSAVQTPRDIEPPPSPVKIAQTAGQNGDSQALPANDPLAQAARQQGEELIPANATPTPATPAERTYVAKAGDSVSRMAARLMGANTARNRAAIIAANASLQSDPNLVVEGQSYVIPGTATAAPALEANSAASGTGPAGTTVSGGQWYYTVKEGDTLWRIATSQLGSASEVESIRELNRDTLHGGTTLQPGMKLRLPSVPVAVAN